MRASKTTVSCSLLITYAAATVFSFYCFVLRYTAFGFKLIAISDKLYQSNDEIGATMKKSVPTGYYLNKPSGRDITISDLNTYGTIMSPIVP